MERLKRLEIRVDRIAHNVALLMKDSDRKVLDNKVYGGVVVRPDRMSVPKVTNSNHLEKDLSHELERKIGQMSKEIAFLIRKNKLDKVEFTFLEGKQKVRVASKGIVERYVTTCFINVRNKENRKNNIVFTGRAVLRPDDNHNFFIARKVAVGDAMHRATKDIKAIVWEKFLAKYNKPDTVAEQILKGSLREAEFSKHKIFRGE